MTPMTLWLLGTPSSWRNAVSPMESRSTNRRVRRRQQPGAGASGDRRIGVRELHPPGFRVVEAERYLVGPGRALDVTARISEQDEKHWWCRIELVGPRGNRGPRSGSSSVAESSVVEHDEVRPCEKPAHGPWRGTLRSASIRCASTGCSSKTWTMRRLRTASPNSTCRTATLHPPALVETARWPWRWPDAAPVGRRPLTRRIPIWPDHPEVRRPW